MNIPPEKFVLHTLAASLILALTSLSQTAHAEAYGSGWYGEVQASYGYEDNISRTAFAGQDDRISSVSFGGGYSAKVGNKAQVIVSSYATYSQHDEFDALDNLAVSVGMDYTVQTRSGYDAPWYNATVNLTNFQYQHSDEREGMLFDVDLSASRRLTPVVTGHLGLRYMDYFFRGKSRAEEENDAAFDTDAQEIYVGMDMQVRSLTYVFAEVALRHGDVRSNYAGGPALGAGLPVKGKFDAKTKDTVFDAPCELSCVSGYAYRVRGDTYIATLGVAFPSQQLGIDLPGVNIDLSASWFEAEGLNGKSYKNKLLKLGVVWNF
jgi:hypothetical protein